MYRGCVHGCVPLQCTREVQGSAAPIAHSRLLGRSRCWVEGGCCWWRCYRAFCGGTVIKKNNTCCLNVFTSCICLTRTTTVLTAGAEAMHRGVHSHTLRCELDSRVWTNSCRACLQTLLWRRINPDLRGTDCRSVGGGSPESSACLCKHSQQVAAPGSQWSVQIDHPREPGSTSSFGTSVSPHRAVHPGAGFCFAFRLAYAPVRP